MSAHLSHVCQPNDYTCAPACVAMLTGRPLAELVAVMRPTPRGGCPNTRITDALRAYGVPCAGRFASVRGRALPERAVVRVTHETKKVGHVVVLWDGWWHDPLLSSPFRGELPPDRVWSRSGFPGLTSRVTSALAVLGTPSVRSGPAGARNAGGARPRCAWSP